MRTASTDIHIRQQTVTGPAYDAAFIGFKVHMPSHLHQPESSECLLRIVEAAPQVRRRYQFFLWSQGDLQRWLPHRLLVCGAYDREQRDVVFDVFNSVPIQDVALKSLHDGREPILASALRLWRQHRQQPCRIRWDQLPQDNQAVVLLGSAGYQQLLVHGLSRPGRPDEIESLFLFGDPQQRYDDASLQAIEMLLPCLHMTYQRVHATERQMAGAGLAASRPFVSSAGPAVGITEREREILVWVRDGLNNQQISEKLGISALTVKNHVQKILRKLGAANRAQAVAKAMTMNALGGSDQGVVDVDK